MILLNQDKEQRRGSKAPAEKERIKMTKNWYQIDWYLGNSTISEGYEMVKATSLDNALKTFFGAGYSDMVIEKKGRVAVVSCPVETEKTWTAQKAAQ